MAQGFLFDDLPVPVPASRPEGLVYLPDFLSAAEEAEILGIVQALPLEAARYKAYTARRRVVSYGGSYDYDANRLLPTTELIALLHPLRDRVADWMGSPPSALVHTLVAEYRPGTPLGWHRDVPEFDEIVGVSLGGEAILRFRPYPPDRPKRAEVVRLTVAPRSIYRLGGSARWGWQHSVAPTPTLRWSITFRTRLQAR